MGLIRKRNNAKLVAAKLKGDSWFALTCANEWSIGPHLLLSCCNEIYIITAASVICDNKNTGSHRLAPFQMLTVKNTSGLSENADKEF